MNNWTHTLETERLILREIREEDADQIVTWRSDPAVYRYFKSPHALTRVEHLDWYKTIYLQHEDRLDWMCLEKETERAVGVFGVQKISETSVEMNYLLALEAQHKGYARESLTALIGYVRRLWKAYCFFAEIHPENKPSIRVAQRLGFHFQKKQKGFLFYALYTS